MAVIRIRQTVLLNDLDMLERTFTETMSNVKCQMSEKLIDQLDRCADCV